jgi:uncharacterized zinc-type alcohol dehydrogenase-like protein
MTTVTAYAASSATEPLTKTTITRRDVGPHDVAFDIHFAGICHSDIHTVKGEWGEPLYPVVPGHEIAGVVTAVGSEVTNYKTPAANVTTARPVSSSTAPAQAWSAPTTPC